MLYARDICLDYNTFKVVVDRQGEISESGDIEVKYFENPAINLEQLDAVLAAV
jgi:hypothetical protein